MTTNATNENWLVRYSSTSRGKILWVDESESVVFFDGITTNTVQLQGTNGTVQEVFGLGSGSSPGQTIGVWRRGTDFAWVSVDGQEPKMIRATNPFNTNAPMNPEGLAIGEGGVFVTWQATAEVVTANDTNIVNVKNVFRVDPATGLASNLTGTAIVLGAQGILSAGGGQAAWSFNPTTNTQAPKELHFYDGSSVRTVDSNIVSDPHIARGRLVYAKEVGGVDQIFLYDSSALTPAPVQLSTGTVGINSYPRTDGEHVGWLRRYAGSADMDIILNGELAATQTSQKLSSTLIDSLSLSFQLQRRQLFWKAISGRAYYVDATGVQQVNPAPAITMDKPRLADGYIAWLGLSSDGGGDVEVFRFTGTPPPDNLGPAPPLLVVAMPGEDRITVNWDQTLDATSYNLYYATEPGLTKQNYQSLLGGTKITTATRPYTINSPDCQEYFFIVTPVVGGVEGPESAVVSGRLCWPIEALAAIRFHAVAADAGNASVAYASGGNAVYKTTDGGLTWSALDGGITGRDIRALGVRGSTVFAASRDGDVLRSTDGGQTLEIAVDGIDIGEQKKSLAIDPVQPLTLYAADFQLADTVEPTNSYVIKSTDGGINWTALPEPAQPEGAEIRAYEIAINPQNPNTIYVGGTGTPNLAKSTDGGTNWTELPIGPGLIYALALDPIQPATVYAGKVDARQFPPESGGVYQSTNSGATWIQKNVGFPTPLPQLNTLVVNPTNPSLLHAGTDQGYYFSTNAGGTWATGNNGLPTSSARSINALALTHPQRLLAATDGGLFLLDFAGNNAVPPKLQIQASANNAILSWPTTAGGFLLETKSNLSPAFAWSAVTNISVTVSNQTTTSVEFTSGNKFFRLQKP